MTTPESQNTVKQLLGEKAAKQEVEGGKVARSEEEDRIREAARNPRGRKE
jgi:hypothetical protein